MMRVRELPGALSGAPIPEQLTWELSDLDLPFPRAPCL